MANLGFSHDEMTLDDDNNENLYITIVYILLCIFILEMFLMSFNSLGSFSWSLGDMMAVLALLFCDHVI